MDGAMETYLKLRLHAELLERFREWCEKSGTTMSEELRSHIKTRTQEAA